MAIQRTNYEHVVMQDGDVPVIAGTATKVIELVLEVHAWGWSPEEICYQHPYLTLGQVHSALAYYWDHKELLDADIARREGYVEQAERELGSSPVITRLKSK
jgi:uncharacterized protein (DUF433 family)